MIDQKIFIKKKNYSIGNASGSSEFEKTFHYFVVFYSPHMVVGEWFAIWFPRWCNSIDFRSNDFFFSFLSRLFFFRKTCQNSKTDLILRIDHLKMWQRRSYTNSVNHTKKFVFFLTNLAIQISNENICSFLPLRTHILKLK